MEAGEPPCWGAGTRAVLGSEEPSDCFCSPKHQDLSITPTSTHPKLLSVLQVSVLRKVNPSSFFGLLEHSVPQLQRTSLPTGLKGLWILTGAALAPPPLVTPLPHLRDCRTRARSPLSQHPTLCASYLTKPTEAEVPSKCRLCVLPPPHYNPLPRHCPIYKRVCRGPGEFLDSSPAPEPGRKTND